MEFATDVCPPACENTSNRAQAPAIPGLQGRAMSKIRSALALASLEQYLTLLVGFATVAALSRLLTPAEIGFAVVGTGLSTIVFSFREFSTTEFLIQKGALDEKDVRTSFTIFMTASAVLGAALLCVSPALARLYGSEPLFHFLAFATFAAMVEALSSPTIALMRRDMDFSTIAWVRIPGLMSTAVVSIGLAYAGHGFVSIAIGAACGAVVTTALALRARPNWRHFLPAISRRHDVFAFGRYKGATTVVDRIYESLPQLVLARLLPLSAVGMYNRANAVCGIPDRLLLSSVFSVAYPALSAALREGQDMKEAYLRSLSYITAVYWPAVLLLAVLADPVVRIVLGPNWDAAVPLVRILSVASVFWFPAILTFPVLASIGANRDAFLANAIGRSTAAAMLCSASLWGLTAMALSQFVNLPVQMLIALGAVRRHIPFTINELLRVLAPIAVTTVCWLSGPLALVGIRGSGFYLSFPESLAVAALAGAGWLAGLALTGHPMLHEVNRVRRRLVPKRRVVGGVAALADIGPAGKP